MINEFSKIVQSFDIYIFLHKTTYLHKHVLIFIHLPASSDVERLFLSPKRPRKTDPSMTDLFFGDYSGAETRLNAKIHKTVLCPTGNEDAPFNS